MTIFGLFDKQQFKMGFENIDPSYIHSYPRFFKSPPAPAGSLYLDWAIWAGRKADLRVTYYLNSIELSSWRLFYTFNSQISLPAQIANGPSQSIDCLLAGTWRIFYTKYKHEIKKLNRYLVLFKKLIWVFFHSFHKKNCKSTFWFKKFRCTESKWMLFYFIFLFEIAPFFLTLQNQSNTIC